MEKAIERQHFKSFTGNSGDMGRLYGQTFGNLSVGGFRKNVKRLDVKKLPAPNILFSIGRPEEKPDFRGHISSRYV